MSSDYYPPGVTGDEPQIAGTPEPAQKHTPGPWHWEKNGVGVPGRATSYRVLVGGNRRILRQAPRLIQARSADELLIAAAPDLLAVCEAFAKWFDGWCPNAVCCAHSGLPVHEQALTAIAKAKGT
jgi:hypothetical protein